MSKDLLSEIDKDHFREQFNKYTRKAFHMLPKLEKPHILDIGCGSGVPTIELAKLSNGEIIGIDINQSLLDKLNRKIEEETKGIGRLACIVAVFGVLQFLLLTFLASVLHPIR